MAGEDVLAELAGVDGGKEGGVECESVEEFGVEEVDLGPISGGWVLAAEVAMLDGGAAVGIALNAKVGEEMDGGLGVFREGVGRVEAGGKDGGLGHVCGYLPTRIRSTKVFIDQWFRCGWVPFGYPASGDLLPLR